MKDIKAGEVITAEHVKSIRPGYGLTTKYLDQVTGKLAKASFMKGLAVKAEVLG